MSSVHPSGGPSPGPSGTGEGAGSLPELGSDLSLVSVLRMRGAPLLGALEAHYPGARERAEAAAAYAFAAAVELGLDRGNAEIIREVTKLHDVGRVYVPAEILAKPEGGRTRDEAALVATHFEKGAQLAAGAGLPPEACEWIRLGAERWDGGGPNRLAGEAIPLPARVARVADACHAALMEAGAQPHAARTAERALQGAAGRELDPHVVAALIGVLARIDAQG